MDFQELIGSVSKLDLAEMRRSDAGYLECVVRRELIPDVCRLLDGYFGPAAKPEGKAPSKEIDALASRFGGVRSNQTFYFFQKDKTGEGALLWPWSDGTLITVKIFSWTPAGSRR